MYADGTWQVDPLRSLVQLRARVLGIGVGCKVDVRGAAITVVDGGQSGAVKAEIDLTTFRSGIDRRDEHVKSADFFDVENHPLAVFTASWQNGPPVSLTGELRLRDVTVPVVIDLTIAPDASDGVTFRGTTQVSRRRFGLTRSRFLLADSIDVAVGGAAHLEGRAPQADTVYGDTEHRPQRPVRP